MNKIQRYLQGSCLVEVKGASPQWALNELANREVVFTMVSWEDPFSVRIHIPRKNLTSAEKYIKRAMCEMTVVTCSGPDILLKRILHRPVLLIMIALSIAVAFWLPRYVLFYQVVGNQTVPEELILRTMDEFGIGFGTLGSDIHPQWVKDRVLGKIPDLEWLTITQNGCRAQVVVRERNHLPETASRKGYADVVATRDGLITSQSVLAGQARTKVGDIVAAGDVLVSGLVDLERTYLLQRAQAEIYARTWRRSQIVTPLVCIGKEYTGEIEHVFSLQIGDKRIKIFGNSRISVGSCDKIIRTSELILPGGLKLPVAWIKETYVAYTPVEIQLSETVMSDILQENVRRCTLLEMVAGEILNESWQCSSNDACLKLTGILECHEMIAASVEAKWEQGRMVHDRENSQCGENGADH